MIPVWNTWMRQFWVMHFNSACLQYKVKSCFKNRRSMTLVSIPCRITNKMLIFWAKIQCIMVMPRRMTWCNCEHSTLPTKCYFLQPNHKCLCEVVRTIYLLQQSTACISKRTQTQHNSNTSSPECLDYLHVDPKLTWRRWLILATGVLQHFMDLV